MVTEHFLVLACRRPALGERAPSLHPPSIRPSQTFQPPLGSAGCFRTNCTQIKVINLCCISKKTFFFSIHYIATGLQILHCTVVDYSLDSAAVKQCAVLLR